MAKVKRSRGLGDTVEKIIHATGLQIFVEGKDCGCEGRRDVLNEMFPYRRAEDKLTPRCLTEDEYNSWKDFKAIRTLTISKEQVDFVCELYASVFDRQLWFPCASCSPKPLISMIDKLDKVFDSYE